MGAKMDWVRRVGTLMVLAALAGQAGAAAPGQQGVGPADQTRPALPVVRDNHEMKQVLKTFWYEGQSKPRFFGNVGFEDSWLNSQFMPTKIIQYSKPRSVLKIKLVRIVFRSKYIVEQLATLGRYESQNIAYYIVAVRPVDPAHNKFWQRLTFGNSTPIQYLAFRVSVSHLGHRHLDPLAYFSFRFLHRTLFIYITHLTALSAQFDRRFNNITNPQILPGPEAYRDIGTLPDISSPIEATNVPP